jgi:hypothetical protein
MSSQETPDGEKAVVIDLVFELPPSPRGTYQRERDDGTVVHGDASGEWTLNEQGEIDDIVFFASPLWLRKARKT